MYSSLSVEVSALGAFVIHLAREQVCEECAQNQDSSENDEGQQSVAQSLHLLPIADRPFVVSL